MPCESCAVQFSVFRRKRACTECERLYCSACLRRGGGLMCAPCRALSTRPLSRHAIVHLKVRDLQCFLQRQNVSTRGCVEKEELVSLCVNHVNSASYRRRGSRGARGGAFSALKGFTANINDFINTALDLRPPGTAPSPAGATHSTSECHNSAHVHTVNSNSNSSESPEPPWRERFTTTPGGEADICVPVPAAAVSRSGSAHAHVDTTDCFEVEDLDDAGWEFVARPADPLPNDSEVLLEEGGGPMRAASELDLRRSESTATDTASLQDEPTHNGSPIHLPEDYAGCVSAVADTSGGHITLEQMSSASALESLSVRQLKELLTRNRVEFRGALERQDLLERAQLLWREHHKYGQEAENLSIEESCKICMSAPLECVLLECGHMAACTACAKQLAECPICRQYVVRAVRVFRS